MKSHILKQEVIIWFDPGYPPEPEKQILINIRQPSGENIIGLGVFIHNWYFMNALGTNDYLEIPREINIVAWCYPPRGNNMEN